MSSARRKSSPPVPDLSPKAWLGLYLGMNALGCLTIVRILVAGGDRGAFLIGVLVGAGAAVVAHRALGEIDAEGRWRRLKLLMGVAAAATIAGLIVPLAPLLGAATGLAWAGGYAARRVRESAEGKSPARR